MSYEIRFTKEAVKDIKKLSPKLKNKTVPTSPDKSGLKSGKEIILNKISLEPYTGRKLIGDLSGFYSVRLSYNVAQASLLMENLGQSHRTQLGLFNCFLDIPYAFMYFIFYNSCWRKQ